MSRKQSIVAALTICLVAVAPLQCHAGITFLGPTPYLSKADSPFPVDGSNPNFFLEDFEDDPGCVPDGTTFCGGGKLDAPGVRMVYGSTGHGLSVDSDDGMIDGTGMDGASATAVPVFGNTDLTWWMELFEIEFNADELGFLPTAVGFVLTDGAGQLSSLSVYDANANVEYFNTWEIHLDPLSTYDDRFIGVINPNGISRINYGKTQLLSSGKLNPPRIDHLQYGLGVPETSATLLFLGLAVFLTRLPRIGWSSLCVFPSRIANPATSVGLVLLSGLGTPADVGAELIRFRLSGTVTVEHELNLPPDVVTGAPFTAYLSYDTSVPDQLPEDPNRGQYFVQSSLGQVELVLQVGSLEIRNADGSDALIQVFNDAGLIPELSPPIDYLSFSIQSIGGPNSFARKLSIDLLDSDATVWNSDSLPTAIDLSALEGALVFAGGGAIRENYYSIQGRINQVIRIPEPSSITNCLMGTMVLVSLNRSIVLKKRRSAFTEINNGGRSHVPQEPVFRKNTLEWQTAAH